MQSGGLRWQPQLRAIASDSSGGQGWSFCLYGTYIDTGFQALVEERITCSRLTRAMNLYQFVLGIVLGLYVGFARLHRLRFIARDPLLTGW